MYQKCEWAFCIFTEDDGEHLRAWKFDRSAGSWNEVEIDFMRIARVEEQLDNMSWSFAATLVMSGFMYSFLEDLRLARFIRKAQVQFELHLGRQHAVSRNFRHVGAIV